MAKSSAVTVQEYLDELPLERRETIERVRQIVLDNLPLGFVESMRWGMITYEIPLERYPDTYNGQPLMYAALAAQKRHSALYLTGVYSDPQQEARLKQAYRESGKRMDVGKSCVRFRRLEDLPLEVIGELIAETTPDDLIALTERAHRRRRKGSGA